MLADIIKGANFSVFIMGTQNRFSPDLARNKVIQGFSTAIPTLQ